MRRLYVTSHDAWSGDHQFSDSMILPRWHLFAPGIGSQFIHLIDYTSQDNAELICSDPEAWEQLPEVQAWRAAGNHILLSGDFHNQDNQAAWEAHPEVATLPHPVKEGNVPLRSLLINPGHEQKKFTQQHMDSLKIIGVNEMHNVWDIHSIASARCPMVRLGNTA
jgi:hypothetical protein